MKEIQVASSTDLYSFTVSVDRIEPNSTAPVIVFIPGLASSKDQWNSFISLVPQQYGVITVELRSHGKNDMSLSPVTIEQMTTDLLDILEHINATSVHLVGYSLGGYIGLNLARKRPDIVKSLTMHATKFFWNESIFSTMNMLVSPELLLEKNPKAVQFMLQDHGEKWQEVLKAGQNILSEVFRSGLKLEDVLTVQCPVVVSVGAFDEFIPATEALELASALPKGTVQVIPFAKHNLKTVPPPIFVASIIATIAYTEKMQSTTAIKMAVGAGS
jgi:pimeloyl-ACP methyl ester carboxylesterase